VWWYNENVVFDHIVRVGPMPSQPLRKKSFAGFGWEESRIGLIFPDGHSVYTPGFHREWWVPNWIIFVTTAILPGVWIVNQLRKRRISDGRMCNKCRYDLTGNTSGVCPECGTAVTAKAGA